jgi:hypothetical protein
MPLRVDLNIINQKGTPAFYSDTFANRPAYGFAGRVFISTDTGAIYEDTGSAWTLIADAGAGTTGTLEQVTTNGNTTTKGITITAGGLSSNSLTDTALTTGSVLFSGAGGLLSESNSTFFWDNTNKRLGIGNASPGAPLDIHGTGTVAHFNGTGANNAYVLFQNAGTGKWRIGNTYSAGANNLDFYNNTLAANALSFLGSTSAATFASSATATQFILSGATSPSGLYYDNASNRVTVANYTTSGKVTIEVNGGVDAATYNADLTVKFENSIGIGSNPTKPLTINGAFNTFSGTQILIKPTTDAAGIQYDASSGGGRIYENQSTTAGQFILYDRTSLAYRIVCSNSGNFIINNGTTDAGYKLDVNGTTRITGAATFTSLSGTGSRAVLADANGTLSAPVSDISVKENIITIGYGLNEILKMNPVWFDYISEYKNYGENRQNGNIAQEMQQIIPEAVFTTPSTNKMGINYDQLHAVYIKAIQELKAEIDQLKNN